MCSSYESSFLHYKNTFILFHCIFPDLVRLWHSQSIQFIILQHHDISNTYIRFSLSLFSKHRRGTNKKTKTKDDRKHSLTCHQKACSWTPISCLWESQPHLCPWARIQWSLSESTHVPSGWSLLFCTKHPVHNETGKTIIISMLSNAKISSEKKIL